MTQLPWNYLDRHVHFDDASQEMYDVGWMIQKRNYEEHQPYLPKCLVCLKIVYRTLMSKEFPGTCTGYKISKLHQWLVIHLSSVRQPVIWNHNKKEQRLRRWYVSVQSNIHAPCSLGLLEVIFYCFFLCKLSIADMLSMWYSCYVCWSLLLVSYIHAINLLDGQWYGVICWCHRTLSPTV